MKKKLIIAVTGASGMIYCLRLLQRIKDTDIEKQLEDVAVVFSDTAKDVWKDEINDLSIENIGFKILNNDSFYVPFASGSSAYDIMIIIPCSMGTLGRIAAGISDKLIGRAADVMLKEHKKLILVNREMPLSLIHINNMKILTEAGAIICPASPAFYNQPQTVNDLVDSVVDRVLDLSGIQHRGKRWLNK